MPWEEIAEIEIVDSHTDAQTDRIILLGFDKSPPYDQTVKYSITIRFTVFDPALWPPECVVFAAEWLREVLKVLSIFKPMVESK